MSTESIYQKPLLYNKFLPYTLEINDESKCLFEDIKRNLSVTIQKAELWPGALYWTNRLNRYLRSNVCQLLYICMCVYYLVTCADSYTFVCVHIYIFCLQK